ncbi:hypothetical protein HanOQP8_Chr04g0162041 [Helianthus annuus]|nr:hypothetical protein HanHA89_Chr04g0163371 [Helianthus annuus]KAJ0758852.1 hypothetical protein HanLR1_Chr04g0154971 [Helianthus annuus]KAJ0762500.1 hypothetical protein HanOQP8_Chr04g0162041 [Helianthus annuus]
MVPNAASVIRTLGPNHTQPSKLIQFQDSCTKPNHVRATMTSPHGNAPVQIATAYNQSACATFAQPVSCNIHRSIISTHSERQTQQAWPTTLPHPGDR